MSFSDASDCSDYDNACLGCLGTEKGRIDHLDGTVRCIESCQYDYYHIWYSCYRL